MILTVNYNKTSGAITLSSNEDEVTVELNQNSVLDSDDSLDFEVALDLSAYQELFNDEILEDGDNNE
jgi:YbbR domain-containing protein